MNPSKPFYLKGMANRGQFRRALLLKISRAWLRRLVSPIYLGYWITEGYQTAAKPMNDYRHQALAAEKDLTSNGSEHL